MFNHSLTFITLIYVFPVTLDSSSIINRRTNGVPQEIIVDRPDPIVFIPLILNTLTTHTSYVMTCLGRLYDDFLHSSCTFITRLGLCPENFTEESDQFRFRRDTYFTHLKGSVGLILTTASAMRVSVPFDLSPWPFIPLPLFIRSRHESTSPHSCIRVSIRTSYT